MVFVLPRRLALACVLTCAACATVKVPTTVQTHPECLEFQVIHADRKTDTEETLQQVDEHNAVWHALCDDKVHE